MLTAPSTARVGEPVLLDGSDSFDPDGVLESWLFEIAAVGTEPDEVLQTASPQLFYTFDQASDFEVTMTVVDNDGTKSSVDTVITVSDP